MINYSKLNPRNERSPDIWRSILNNIDVNRKIVSDLGCGYGDYIELSILSGAKHVYAYDNDNSVIENISGRFKGNRKVSIFNRNVEKCNIENSDIGICLSVLPYLDDPDRFLRRLYNRCNVVFLECQYNGDYDGLYYIDDDSSMNLWLQSVGFKEIEKIGSSRIIHTGVNRSLWLCSKEKMNTSYT